jgi:hypothetical protein
LRFLLFLRFPMRFMGLVLHDGRSYDDGSAFVDVSNTRWSFESDRDAAKKYGEDLVEALNFTYR